MERAKPQPVDEESRRRFEEAQEAYTTGGTEGLATFLADDDPAMVDEYMRHIESLQGTDPEVVQASLHRLEDEAILSDPDFQESLRQAEAGELRDITPEA